jgi:HSP20 family protein
MPSDPPESKFWVPRLDVFITATGDFIIKAELPALRRGDLDLAAEDQRLMIAGRRPDEDRSNGASKYLISEISSGPFQCVVEVPATHDLKRAKAKYQNGVLRIVIPQRQPPLRKSLL